MISVRGFVFGRMVYFLFSQLGMLTQEYQTWGRGKQKVTLLCVRHPLLCPLSYHRQLPVGEAEATYSKLRIA